MIGNTPATCDSDECGERPTHLVEGRKGEPHKFSCAAHVRSFVNRHRKCDGPVFVYGLAS